MTTIPVIFQNGTFQPLHPIKMAEGTRADVILQTSSKSDSSLESNNELNIALSAIASIPLGPTSNDGLPIGKDHDLFLYGLSGENK